MAAVEADPGVNSWALARSSLAFGYGDSGVLWVVFQKTKSGLVFVRISMTDRSKAVHSGSDRANIIFSFRDYTLMA